MKPNVFLSILFTVVFLFSCGNDSSEKKSESIKIGNTQKEDQPATPTKKEASATIDMSNKGIGPVKSLTLNATIDDAMVLKGMETYKAKCTACHKADKKFIGPAPTGILERRSPEWIMNMILNPQEMVEKDPIARQLLIDYNGSPMANQSLTEEEARNILEYFRTLK
jgi:mono/diheme cytochrome c family protein